MLEFLEAFWASYRFPYLVLDLNLNPLSLLDSRTLSCFLNSRSWLLLFERKSGLHMKLSKVVMDIMYSDVVKGLAYLSLFQ